MDIMDYVSNKNNNQNVDNLIGHIKNKHYLIKPLDEQSEKGYEDFFDSFIKLFNIDSFKPRLVNNKEFENNQGREVYRGYDSNILEFLTIKKDFLSGDYQRYHKTSNNFGPGLYFLDDLQVVKEDFYGENPIKKIFNSTIISAKIDDNKIINAFRLDEIFESQKGDIIKSLKNKLNNVLDKEIDEFVDYIISSKQYIFKALLLGYDGIQYDLCGKDKSGKDHKNNAYVIYNRECLMIKNTLLNKLIAKTTNGFNDDKDIELNQ